MKFHPSITQTGLCENRRTYKLSSNSFTSEDTSKSNNVDILNLWWEKEVILPLQKQCQQTNYVNVKRFNNNLSSWLNSVEDRKWSDAVHIHRPVRALKEIPSGFLQFRLVLFLLDFSNLSEFKAIWMRIVANYVSYWCVSKL